MILKRSVFLVLILLLLSSCSADWGRVKFSDPALQQKFRQKLEKENINYQALYDYSGNEFLSWNGNSQSQNRDLINDTVGLFFGLQFEKEEYLNTFTELLKSRNIPYSIKTLNQRQYLDWNLAYNSDVYKLYNDFKVSNQIEDGQKQNYCTKSQLANMATLNMDKLEIEKKCNNKSVVFEYIRLNPSPVLGRNLSYESTFVSMGFYLGLGHSEFDISAKNRKNKFTGDRWGLGWDTELRVKDNIISNITLEIGTVDSKDLEKEFIQYLSIGGSFNYWFNDIFSGGVTLDYISMTITTPLRNQPNGGGLVQEEAKGDGFGLGVLFNWQISRCYTSYGFRKSALGGEIDGEVVEHFLAIGIRI